MAELEEYQIEIKESKDQENFPPEVLIIPIMNSPIFPGMIAPIILSEEKFTQELDNHLMKAGFVALNLVKSDYSESEGEEAPFGDDDIDEDDLGFDEREISSKDIYKVGVICKVVKKLKLPDGSVNILVHGVKRYRAAEILSEAPLLMSKIEVFDDILEADEELDAYTRSVINQVKKLSEINPYFNEEMKLAMLNSPSPGALADLV
ncbi:MAG: LON peptidase substrate-binding domain-containing protein, partial [Bdellovibrionota bacterium]|nr:LON peptidase substrate-binding domain-containing protein [Bdellovibrionota bacterium]